MKTEYTDEQIAEALRYIEAPNVIPVPLGFEALDAKARVLAFALRAAQERIKEMEAKTVPMEMLQALYDAGYHDAATTRGHGIVKEYGAKIAARYDYTVTESKEEER